MSPPTILDVHRDIMMTLQDNDKAPLPQQWAFTTTPCIPKEEKTLIAAVIAGGEGDTRPIGLLPLTLRKWFVFRITQVQEWGNALLPQDN